MPVILDGRTIFTFRIREGGFLQERRGEEERSREEKHGNT